jgi:hypothetical protein
MRMLRAAPVLLMFCLVSACGGGGSGSTGGGGGGGGGGNTPPVTGNGTAPPSGPGDTQAYYPLANTNAWDYNYTTTDPQAVTPSGILGTQVTGTKTLMGLNAAILYRYDPTSPSPVSESYYNVGPGGVTYLGNDVASDTLTPQLVPYVQQLFPVTLGTVSTVKGTNLPDGTDSGGHPITLDLTQTIANAAFETVEVPAGTYKNALRQTTTITTTATDNGQTVPVNGLETTWYVAGVGPVKDTTSVTGGGQTITTDAEMRFADVNATAYGFAPEQQLALSTLAPAAPVITSDGSNFLIVAQQFTGAGTASPMSNFVGTIVSPYQSTVATFNLTAPAPVTTSGNPLFAVAGFDGSNYLVVYESDPAVASQPRTLNAVAISPAGAVVAGPNLLANVGVETGGVYGPHPEALAFDGTHFLLLFQGTSSALQGLFVTAGSAQAVGTPFALGGTSLPIQPAPALAFGGGNYLLAYFDSDSLGNTGIFAQRVSAAGVVLDATPLQVMAENFHLAGENSAPALSYDGSNFLLTYLDFRGANPGVATVSAARIAPGLTLLDGTADAPGIQVTHAANAAALAVVFMEREHWIVWASPDTTAPLSASRVTPGGAVAAGWTEGFVLAAQGTGAGTPGLAASASGGYLTYVAAPGPIPSSLMGLRIYPSGP